MTRIIRQNFSGKHFTVIREDANWLILRPIPDDLLPDIRISREMYLDRWQEAKGVPPESDPQPAFSVSQPPRGIGVPKPEPRKRGRPKGSKNRK